MKKNDLCQLLGIRYPIVQGGMVWVSNWRLASACAEAGILGTLGAGSMSLDELRENIRTVRRRTEKPFAVNIPLLRPDALAIAEIACEEGVRIVITSAGNPSRIVPAIKSKGAIVIHVVPSTRGAIKAVSVGADAVICEGYEAGGHNSPLEITTLALVPQVADAVDVPVVAAGGIADGRGMAAAMALGADGIQMGTRFIATRECNAHPVHKSMIVDSPDNGTLIIGRQLDMLRVLRSPFAERMEQAEKDGLDRAALLELIGDEFNRNRAGSIEGDREEGAYQAGQSAGIVKQILPVKELVRQLITEYDLARKNLNPL